MRVHVTPIVAGLLIGCSVPVPVAASELMEGFVCEWLERDEGHLPRAQQDLCERLSSGVSSRDSEEALLPVPPPPSIVIAGAKLRDNGDDDLWADTHETVSLELSLYNRMGIDLTGVRATLQTTDATIACIPEAVVEVGEFAAGATKLTPPFTFVVADVERSSVAQPLTASLSLRLSSDQIAELPIDTAVVLDLDLDAEGGAGPTQYFEGFESGFGSFTTMQLDEFLNPPESDLGNYPLGVQNADGYRCQYNDPDWEGSRTYETPQADECFPNRNGGHDAFYWSSSDDRAFSGLRSLYFGFFLDPARGHTTPTAQLEAVRTTSPIYLAWSEVCSTTRTTPCTSALDCPIGEGCVPARPTLTIKHQSSFVDYRAGAAPWGRGVDRGVVQLQVVDEDGTPVTDWMRLRPQRNVYDQQPFERFPQCTFDPTDDGSTEESFFDPADPDRLLGPSSSCYPEFNFSVEGATSGAFDPDSIGNASDGPGLAGEVGEGTWIESSFSMERFRGRRVLLRFLQSGIKLGGIALWEIALVFNPDPRDDGWWIDDVLVTDALTTAASVSADAKDNSDLEQDFDFDDVAAVCDCDPHDGAVWMLPGEVPQLVLNRDAEDAGATTLTWTAPPDPGGTQVAYDTLRSSTPADFTAADCIESGDGSDTTASDPVTPASGNLACYLVRARNACGAGSPGETSAGIPRTAVDCP